MIGKAHGGPGGTPWEGRTDRTHFSHPPVMLHRTHTVCSQYSRLFFPSSSASSSISSFSPSFHTSARSLVRNPVDRSHANFVAIQLQRSRNGGKEVLVQDSNVQHAYSRLNTLCRDGRVRQAERNSRHYIKPKHRRQARVEKIITARQSEEFRDKVQIALELMKLSPSSVSSSAAVSSSSYVIIAGLGSSAHLHRNSNST